MRVGITAARRLAFVLGTLLLVTASPLASGALAESRSAYDRLGHAWMTVDTDLRATSHVSAWAIDQYLAQYTPLPPLGHAFKAAEAKYDVNALYLLAHAMHETGFGTSYIGQQFHNLFGWNAYDRDPTGMATRFPTYAASVDYVARQISELYLTPYGKYYGGASTLRGMHYYASDPQWADLIARIANGITLATLSHRGVAFGRPDVGEASSGRPVTVTLTTKSGGLPDGLRAAYRWIPVAIVEAGSPTGSLPAAKPDFRLARGSSRNGAIRLSVDAPKRAGRYRLELEIRDSDGTVLSERNVPRGPSTGVRVFGTDAVVYDLQQTADGLKVSVTNEGRLAIPPSAAAAGVVVGVAPTPAPTTLRAWLVGDEGTPVLLGEAILGRTMKPGSVWTTLLPVPDATMLPAVLLVRLEIGGAPGRLGGSPPGVFRLTAHASAAAPANPSAPPATASPSADPSASFDPAASPAPSASSDPTAVTSTVQGEAGPSPTTADPSGVAVAPNGAAQTGAPSLQPSPSPDAPPVQVAIGSVTPLDVTTRVLLNPSWKPTTKAAKTKASAAVKPVLTATVKAPVARIVYQPLVDPRHPGRATIRITNTGNAPLVISQPAAIGAAVAPSEFTAVTDTMGAGAVLLVTAIPAWGPAREPVLLSIPLRADLAPGKSVDIAVTLPASAVGQSSFLVVARVVRAGGHSSFAPTLFWLRSALPTRGAHASATAPALSSMTPGVSVITTH